MGHYAVMHSWSSQMSIGMDERSVVFIMNKFHNTFDESVSPLCAENSKVSHE